MLLCEGFVHLSKFIVGLLEERLVEDGLLRLRHKSGVGIRSPVFDGATVLVLQAHLFRPGRHDHLLDGLDEAHLS